MAADNIAMAAYLTAIMIIPAKNFVATPQDHDCAALNRADCDSTAAQNGIDTIALLHGLIVSWVAVLAAAVPPCCYAIASLSFACSPIMVFTPPHLAVAAAYARYDNTLTVIQCHVNAHCVAGHASIETRRFITAEVTATTSGAAPSDAVAAAPTVESIALALAFGIAACALGQFLAGAVGLPSINLAAMAVVASLFASVASSVTASTDATAATPFKGDNYASCAGLPGSELPFACQTCL